MSYMKTVNLSMLRESDLAILKDTLDRMGFSNSDYRIVEYGSNGKEMKIMSPFLHRTLKVIRKTTYSKKESRHDKRRS